MFSYEKFYSIEDHKGKQLVTPITIKESYTVFQTLAASSHVSDHVGLPKEEQKLFHIQEVPEKDLPLWVGSPYISTTFEKIIQGVPYNESRPRRN
jgi:hypothetical protein